MSKKNWYLLTGSICFVLFVFLTYLVQKQVFTHSDFVITVWLQQHVSRVVDVPFSLFSLIGSLEVSGIAFIILLIIGRKRISGTIALVCFAATHVFELYGKTFVRHPGPPLNFLRYDLRFNFPSSYVQPGSSYPSGHAARAFFITTTLFLLTIGSKKLPFTQKLLIFCCLTLYDVVMCLSRVYLAEHWTSDVIGGMVSGVGLALISGAFL